jgi:uncharacterized protein
MVLAREMAMTPQEHQLVNDLFDRLAKLENGARDTDAERAISSGLQRAPHAVYALVQTSLMQDRALRQASARIRELESNVSESAMQEPQRSFLGNPSDDPRDLRGSASRPLPTGQAYPPQAPMPRGPNPSEGPPGSGGAFLGSAASAAAGAIGGSLLVNSIRSIFGKKDRDASADFGRQTSASNDSTDTDDFDEDRIDQDENESAEHSIDDSDESSDMDDSEFSDDDFSDEE